MGTVGIEMLVVLSFRAEVLKTQAHMDTHGGNSTCLRHFIVIWISNTYVKERN